MVALTVAVAGVLGGAVPAVAQEAPTSVPPAATAAVIVPTLADATAALRSSLGLTGVTQDGAGIDVAIIDTGVVPVPGVPADRISYGPDLTLDVANPQLRNLDTFGHGTNMASLILAVAPKARIVSVKVGSATAPASLASIIGGIDWARTNATTGGRNIKVISVSFGLTPDVDGGLVAGALRKAWAAGITVVASAGNGGNGSARLDAPANDRGLLAVGAIDLDPLGLAPFSSGSNSWYNRGPDIVAPGVDVVGARVPGSWLDQSFPDARVGTDGFRGSGTSQAAALTAGTVALVLQRRPWLSPDQVKAVLRSSADALPAVPVLQQGMGALDADGAVVEREPSRFTASWNNNLSFFWWLRLPTLGELLAPLSLAIWNGDPWNGNRWSGNRWSGNRWSGERWE